MARNVRVVTGPRATGQVERAQEMADALAARSLRSRNPEQPWPVATAMSPWEGVAQLGEALVGAKSQQYARRLAEAQEAGQRAANERMIRDLAGERTPTRLTEQGAPIPNSFRPPEDLDTGQPMLISDKAERLAAAMQGMDPAQANQVLSGAVLSRELAGGPQEEAFTLGPGQVRYQGGREIARGPADAPKMPSEVQEYEYYAAQERAAGRRPAAYNDWRLQARRASAPSTTINTGEDRWGKPPAGYYRPDPLRPDVAPMPGSEDAYEREQTASKGATRARQVVESSQNVIDTAQRAIDQVSGWTAGWGALLANLPETEARNLQATLTTIKANLGFDRLQQMRDASPTGGALGQVAIQELAALQAALASLDQAQSGDQLVANLKAVVGHYQNWKRITLGGAPMLQDPSAAPNAAPNAASVQDRARGYLDE